MRAWLQPASFSASYKAVTSRWARMPRSCGVSGISTFGERKPRVSVCPRSHTARGCALTRERVKHPLPALTGGRNHSMSGWWGVGEDEGNEVLHGGVDGVTV